MIEIFNEFEQLLDKRFKKKIDTTEDSIRYTFFASLLNHGIAPDEVILEYPHPNIPRAKIDTWLPNYLNNHSIALEFKYDRDIPSGKNQPKTQKAGNIFKDIKRLVYFLNKKNEKVIRAYFIYVTNEKMANYLQSNFSDFWNLQQKKELFINESYLNKRPKTFLISLNGIFDARIICILNSKLSSKHYLRIYEIKQ